MYVLQNSYDDKLIAPRIFFSDYLICTIKYFWAVSGLNVMLYLHAVSFTCMYMSHVSILLAHIMIKFW